MSMTESTLARAIRGGVRARAGACGVSAHGPRQPDRRAHRLQRRLRAAAGRAAADPRRAGAAPGRPGAGRQPRASTMASLREYQVGAGAGRARLAGLRPGRDLRCSRRPGTAVRRLRRWRSNPTCRSGAGSRRARRCWWRCCGRSARPFGLDLDDVTLARLAQRAEVEFVGARVGIMDQLCGQPRRRGARAVRGYPLASSYERVPFPDALDLVVIGLGRRPQQRGRRLQHPPRRVRAGLRPAGRRLAARRRAAGPAADRRAAGAARPAARATSSPRTSASSTPSRRCARADLDDARRAAGGLAPLDARRLRGLGAGDRPAGGARVRAEPDTVGARLTGGGFGGSILALTPARQRRRGSGGAWSSSTAPRPAATAGCWCRARTPPQTLTASGLPLSA